MASVDVAMDVDDQASKSTTTSTETPLAPKLVTPLFPILPPKKPVWVAKPSCPEDLGSNWTDENSSQKRIIQFLKRWPPSKTPAEYGPWITAYRGGMKDAKPNLEGLAADFQSLLSGDNVKPASLDTIAKTNNVLLGKWMIFEEPSKIDILWGKVLYYLCMERKRGMAKVSTFKEDEKHVIEVYVDDYTDKAEVNAVRKALRGCGVKWKIGFKPDAYSHLNIYKENPWKIRPSRYLE
ncbi:hypothetical protein CVT26_012608 [Gymnopilus dilepis]|uniref:DUF1917 domain-containing protein n=1 Tax=Gymnopilus dilepis TaxID=231916 RepID=A0A409YVX0_9AGAR|nr:hypothetical protein CVT26_012608 [Gymnopilus dilepis]